MKTKLVLVALSLISLLPVLRAQEQTDTYTYKNSKHAIGFSGGYSIGSGLSYRHTFEKFGMQLSGFPNVSDNFTQFGFGLTFLYDLVQTDKSKFFLYQGNRFDYTEFKKSTQTSTIMIADDWAPIERELVNSLGIGYEFLVYDRIGLSFMGGYAFSARDYKANSVSFTGEFSALYHF